jgi:hypothetical protein
MTEPRVIRSISAADFARISDEFAKTMHPKDAMIFEIHALRAERDALRTFVSVSGRWVRKYGTYNAVPTPEALEDFGELMQAYNALEGQP